MFDRSGTSAGTSVGLAGAILAGIAGLVLLFVPLGRSVTCTPGGECTVGRGVSGIDYLLGAQGADPALFFWSLFLLGVALVGGYGAWTATRWLVWVTALALLALSVLAIASIGLFVAPAALLFLLAAILLHTDRTGVSSG